MSQPNFSLRARLVFPADGPVIESGVVRIADERIVELARATSPVDLDCGNAAILPGFINAHTHLELSTVRAAGFAGTKFVEWLARVIAARRDQDAAQVSHAVNRGIDSSLASGTTLVGDISTSGRSWKELIRSPLRAVVFAELLGLKPDRARQTAEAARQFLEWTNPKHMDGDTVDSAAVVRDAATPVGLSDGSEIEPFQHVRAASATQRVVPSLSPHAPYSTHPALYGLAANWAERTRVPVCTHLAETQGEIRLLSDRAGPFREFLMSIGAWDEQWMPVGPSPIDYVESSTLLAADWIIAHANYVNDAEIGRLGAHASGGPTRSVVYCPRTHAYFGHRNHPYVKLLEARVNVCLGTDSLASSPTLSILDEMRFLHRRDRALDSLTLLQMGTLAGARALNRDHVCGSLTPGKFADLAIVRLPDRESTDPYELLWDSTEPVIRTIIGGRTVFQKRGA